MLNLKGKLSRKFLILSKSVKSNGEIKTVDKSIRYPQVCYKDYEFTRVPAIKIRNNGSYKKTFSFNPVTTVVKELKLFTKKEEAVVEKEIKSYVTTYIPMLQIREGQIAFDHSYKALIKGLEFGIYSQCTHDVYLENAKKYEGLSKKYEEMPDELQEEIDRRVNNFVDSFDAFEISNEKVPYFATIEETGNIECEIKGTYFYKFNENSLSYESDISKIKDAVSYQAYMIR